MTTSTETRPWQKQLIDQLADADTEGATHVIAEQTDDTATLLDLAGDEGEAATLAARHAVNTENDVSVIALETLYGWHKEQIAQATNDVEENKDSLKAAADALTEAVVDIIEDAHPGLLRDEEDDLSPEDPDTGKLFDVPRVSVILDDADPTVLKLAFTGSIELERGEKTWVDYYNRLRAGKSVQLDLTAHVAGSKKTHRRDSEGNVDAIVETKSLIVTDVHAA